MPLNLRGLKARRSRTRDPFGDWVYWCAFCLSTVPSSASTACGRHKDMNNRLRRAQPPTALSDAADTQSEVTYEFTQARVDRLANLAYVVQRRADAVLDATKVVANQPLTVAEFRIQQRQDLVRLRTAVRDLAAGFDDLPTTSAD